MGVRLPFEEKVGFEPTSKNPGRIKPMTYKIGASRFLASCLRGQGLAKIPLVHSEKDECECELRMPVAISPNANALSDGRNPFINRAAAE